jgi:polysaccharide export outer membrane protein
MRYDGRAAGWLSAIAILAGMAGCSQPVAYDDASLTDLVQASVSGAALGPGDTFEVRVYRDADLSGVFQVSPSGMIDYPLLGTLPVGGLNSQQIAARIREGLAAGYVRDPYVTVTVKEFLSKRVYVLGQVEKPGTFRYEDGMSVIQAITLAGGVTKTSRPNEVVVTRQENGREVRFSVPVRDISEGKARNLFLRPGDIVYVPESIL